MSEITPPDSPNELPPTSEQAVGSLGRYKILGELGRGGCGVVYRALDPSIGRVVAIKTILAKTESASGEESRQRFRREARSAGGLSHPNIVTVHDFSDSGDPMFIAMEFVEGRTLADYMSAGRLSLDFILKVLRSAADALDYAHSQRIVHRDVKPANFLIDQSGRLKITDFGIAKLLDSEEGLTSTGMLVGTAQYMSPEQISEKALTGRSDQFSLAVIAYEMLTGVKPFQGNSWASVISAIIMAEPPNVAVYRDSLGESVNIVLRKALSKVPEFRYATCSEFCEALEQGLVGSTLDRTEILYRTKTAIQIAPVELKQTQVPNTEAAKVASSTTREVIKEARKPHTFKPLLVGAVGGAVIAASLWFGLRSRKAPVPTPVSAVQPSPALNSSATPPPSQPIVAPEVEPTRVPKVLPSAKHEVKTVAPAKPPHPSDSVKAKFPAAQPIESMPVPSAPPVVAIPLDPAPAVPPPQSSTKAQEDQARAAAAEQVRRQVEDQTKRVAAEQAKRIEDEQAKRVTEDQNKRVADEQARNTRIAENAAILRALREYQSAYERRDAAALQKIWPSIPKLVLEGVRSSFHDASEVSMELRAVGDPKVSGAVATVLCDRSLRQVIMKRALQASGRVNIVLNRAPSGWTIQSVVPVSQ